MSKYFMTGAPVRFAFPIDGDCVNERDGRKTDSGVIIPVKVEAPEGHEIYICGEVAKFDGGIYVREISITESKTTLTAKDATSGDEASITVFYMPSAVKKFRLSSDDNILFLQDLTKNKDVYKSVFENPYLAVYKKAHDLYGAAVHLNLFYLFDGEHKNFPERHEYFDLSMMTDKFRDEFRANSDWLRFSFHSLTENPPKPYQFATPEKILEDYDKVCREIIRFAGEECLSDTTTIHFGEANVECARALRAHGTTTLTGYFEHTPKGAPLVAYYAPDDLIDHVGERDFWYDTDEDILFGRIDLVLNSNTYDWVMEEMDKILASPTRSGFVSIMIHEQYFYEDYSSFRPDFSDRVLHPCRLLFENGYTGAHISELSKGIIK